MLRLTRSGAAVAAAALLATLSVQTSGPAAQEGVTPAVLDAIPFRNFGPFRAGAWITDFAVPAALERSHRYTFYVGTRNGGLWKTENGGTTFRSIFDATGQWSIGAVAVAPSDERVVFAGTGESFVVRYSYPGNGVYKSTDAGETWQHMGLAATRHIARILVHPTDPNIVYVASMGPLHTTSPDRGVYRTRDGGRTWDHVLAIDNEVGVIELVMNPKDPAILYAAAYDRSGRHGGCARADPAAASTGRPTPATTGRGSRAGSRPETSAASASTSSGPTRTCSTPSSRTSTRGPRVCRSRVRSAAGSGRSTDPTMPERRGG
jgi:hypothetical protein